MESRLETLETIYAACSWVVGTIMNISKLSMRIPLSLHSTEILRMPGSLHVDSIPIETRHRMAWRALESYVCNANKMCCTNTHASLFRNEGDSCGRSQELNSIYVYSVSYMTWCLRLEQRNYAMIFG